MSTQPRPYNLADPKDRDRLLHETVGYALASLHHGNDAEGRRYAFNALKAAILNGYRLMPPEPVPAPPAAAPWSVLGNAA